MSEVFRPKAIDVLVAGPATVASEGDGDWTPDDSLLKLPAGEKTGRSELLLLSEGVHDELLFLDITEADRLKGGAGEGLVARLPIGVVARGVYVDAAEGEYGIPGMEGDVVFVLVPKQKKR